MIVNPFPGAEVLEPHPVHTPEWYAQRAQGIGSSDASAVMGRSKWATPYDVWLDKTTEPGPREAGEAALWGTKLEPVVREHFADLHRDTLNVYGSISLRSVEYPFMQANLDGWTCPVEAPDAADAIIEVKTTSAWNGDEWGNGEVGEHALWQVQHSLAVTGLDYAWVVALVGGQRYVEEQVFRDDDMIDMLIAHERELWERVQTGQAPALGAPTPRAVKGMQVAATPDIVDTVSEYDALGDRIAALEAERKPLRAAIEAFMGEGDTLLGPDGEVIATWRESKATTKVDTKRLCAEHPDLAAQYGITVPGTRRLLVK